MTERAGDPWRVYRGEQDRRAAQAVLRTALAAGQRPHTIHPGEWDWWCFHHDPRVARPRAWLAEAGLLELGADGELSAFGPQAWAALPARVREDPEIRSVGWVCAAPDGAGPDGAGPDGAGPDGELLAALGLAPTGPRMTVLERSTAPGPSTDGDDAQALPPGYAVRSLRPAEAQSRADAARLAFGSTMDPAMHRARYRAFMASPGYEADRDVVAVGPDGSVAAFAVVWADDELSLAQLEPVGTRPDRQRLGLGRAVLAQCRARMAARGVRRIRVVTWEHRAAAVAFYRGCGFRPVTTLQWWERAPG